MIEDRQSVCCKADVEFREWEKHPTKKGTFVEPAYWCLGCNLPCNIEEKK